MPKIKEIADRYNLAVVEDSCQAIHGSIDGKSVGSWGLTAAFSLHPLKNLNVWADGGVIITHSQKIADKLRLYRNHGLVSRDVCESFGINSRLDAIQAVVGNRLIPDVNDITKKRRANAERYDQAFASMASAIDIPVRRSGVRHVFHLYVIRVKRRDDLLAYLIEQGIGARIHYPHPVHLQPAARHLGYKKGAFPIAEEHGRVAITLPVHQHLTDGELDFVIEKIQAFYGS